MFVINDKVGTERSRLILYPDSFFRSFWDFLVFMIVIY